MAADLLRREGMPLLQTCPAVTRVVTKGQKPVAYLRSAYEHLTSSPAGRRGFSLAPLNSTRRSEVAEAKCSNGLS